MDSPRLSLEDRISRALLDLGTASSLKEMEEKVAVLSRSYPAAVLLDALVKVLPDADSQLQGGLGLLAQQLPRQVTEEKLLQQVLNGSLTAHVRFSAVTILQDYLERPVDPRFVSDISDVDSVILASMQDAFRARSKYPGVLVEYTEQFSRLEFQHRQYVLDLLQHVKIEDATDLLQTMAYSQNPEVGQQALDALSTLKGGAGEQILYVLSQSLYLDTDLADTARRLLRKLRILGNRHSPPPLPRDSLARFLGFHKDGVAHWYLSNEALPYGLMVGYGFRQGVQSVQKTPHTSVLAGGQQSSQSSSECKLDWVRWHLSYTLSRFPPEHRQQGYPEMYQLLAADIWQWEPPSEGSEALETICQSSPLSQENSIPASIELKITELPYESVLRNLCLQEPKASATERLSLCAWFLNVSALALWPKQKELASHWATTARLLDEDPVIGPGILIALLEHWKKQQQ